GGTDKGIQFGHGHSGHDGHHLQGHLLGEAVEQRTLEIAGDADDHVGFAHGHQFVHGPDLPPLHVEVQHDAEHIDGCFVERVYVFDSHDCPPCDRINTPIF